MPHLTLLDWMENGSRREFRLIKRVACHWEDLALAGLGMEQCDIDNAKGVDNITSCRNLLRKFLDNGSPRYKKPTWCNLLEALRRAELSVVADALENGLRHL